MEPRGRDHHDAVIANAVARHGGTLVRERGEGDSTFSVFPRATGAIARRSCRRAQRAWRARCSACAAAIHTGDALVRDGEYAAAAINRCARIREVAFGGQTLVSEQTRNVAADDLPAGVSLLDLGTHRLRDLAGRWASISSATPTLPSEFPALRIARLRTAQPPAPTHELHRTRRRHHAGPQAVRSDTDGQPRRDRRRREDAARAASRGAGRPTSTPTACGSSTSPRCSDPDDVAHGASHARSGCPSSRDGRSRTTLLEHLRAAKRLCSCSTTASTCSTRRRAFVTKLLRSCPSVSVLATSREAAARRRAQRRVPVPGAGRARRCDGPPKRSAATSRCGCSSSAQRSSARASRSTHDNGADRGAHLPPPRRHPARDRARGRARRVDVARARSQRRLDDRFRLLTGGGPRRAAPRDPAGGGRLEPRPALARPSGAVPPPGGLRRRVHARRRPRTCARRRAAHEDEIVTC